MRFFLWLSLSFSLCFQLVAQDSATQSELISGYRLWREAMIRKDVGTWQRITSGARQMSTRNLIVSQKQSFPQALFDIPMMPPPIDQLRLIKVSQVGDTAALVYFGKVDIGVEEPSKIPDNLLVIRFVREAGRWKFNTTRLVNLESAPHVRAELQQRGSSSFISGPDFEADGVIEPIQPACPTPQYMGMLRVAALGYKVHAKVNNFPSATVANNAEEHLIIGGLKRGDNVLDLHIEALDLPEGARRSLVIHALVITGNSKRPAIRVFTYSPDQLPSSGNTKLNIVVSPMTMR